MQPSPARRLHPCPEAAEGEEVAQQERGVSHLAKRDRLGVEIEYHLTRLQDRSDPAAPGMKRQTAVLHQRGQGARIGYRQVSFRPRSVDAGQLIGGESTVTSGR